VHGVPVRLPPSAAPQERVQQEADPDPERRLRAAGGARGGGLRQLRRGDRGGAGGGVRGRAGAEAAAGAPRGAPPDEAGEAGEAYSV